MDRELVGRALERLEEFNARVITEELGGRKSYAADAGAIATVLDHVASLEAELTAKQGKEDMAARVADILFPAPERIAGEPETYVSHDAIDNLEGVIASLKGRSVGACIYTLERIMVQIIEVRDLVKRK